MTATYSIQGSDLSTRLEGEGRTAGQIKSIFENFDWESESLEQARLESAGSDSCPAGMSIVREPSVFLHSCPQPNGTIMTHCIHTQPKTWFFGLFKTTQTTNLNAEHLEWSTAMTAISKFLAADNAWLLRNIKED